MIADLIQRGEQLIDLMDAEEHQFLAVQAGDCGQIFCATGEITRACAALDYPDYRYVTDSPDVQGWGQL